MTRAQRGASEPSREGGIASVDADDSLPRSAVPAPTLEDMFSEWLPELPFAWWPDAQ